VLIAEVQRPGLFAPTPNIRFVVWQMQEEFFGQIGSTGVLT
jgi:hypothetical protein